MYENKPISKLIVCKGQTESKNNNDNVWALIMRISLLLHPIWKSLQATLKSEDVVTWQK